MLVDYLKHWLEDVSRPAVRESTYVRYESLIRTHVAPHIGGIQLSNLQPSHIQNLYRKLEQAGNSPRTRELAHAILHKALK
ncbi:MAG: N-terminal phage integrase SAM-like domain-containing protein [Myxococcaceae bacterium]